VWKFVFKLRPPTGKTIEEYRKLGKTLAITQIIHRATNGGVMKQLGWFLLGAAVMVGGQALAQSYIYQDNQGRSATLNTVPGMPQQDWNGPARIMQQQLNGILQNSQRNPC
jgi:uncharacterized iron-regulated membrane protein